MLCKLQQMFMTRDFGALQGKITLRCRVVYVHYICICHVLVFMLFFCVFCLCYSMSSFSFPMNTDMTGFRYFPKIVLCALDESNLSNVNFIRVLLLATVSSPTFSMKAFIRKQSWEIFIGHNQQLFSSV